MTEAFDWMTLENVVSGAIRCVVDREKSLAFIVLRGETG
jgi:hypothetical protein